VSSATADTKPPDWIIRGDAKPHYFLPGDVLEAALKRMRWLFDEFDNHVSVSTSGGKDSTVVLELAAMVAKERGCLPLKAHFLDQEAEYQATIDYMRTINERPDIDLDWYQIPFKLFNASSHSEQWSHVWDPELDDSTWIRPKEPGSIRENTFFDRKGKQVDRFKEILGKINEIDGGAILTGMRCEESPTRRVFMTSVASYKWATWCSGMGKSNHALFHPIYDWSYRDVWKAIHDHGWVYNTFYDKMFQYGISTRGMRVSSFHHEQSQWALDYLQEVEPQTWERATRRLPGLSTYAHVGEDIAGYYQFHLPYMFTSVAEYTLYLIDNLIEREEDRERFRKMWAAAERQLPYIPRREIARLVLYMVMFNDVYGSNMNAWVTNQRGPGKEREWRLWWAEQRRLGRYPESEEEGRAV
jgi:predicted phosphoadenosine phosphosulfate sulfurtransferase